MVSLELPGVIGRKSLPKAIDTLSINSWCMKKFPIWKATAIGVECRKQLILDLPEASGCTYYVARREHLQMP
jgi:hypothetical protein